MFTRVNFFAVMLIVLSIHLFQPAAQAESQTEQVQNYNREMRELLTSKWRQEIEGKNIANKDAQIKVTIGPRGDVLSYEWVKRSGDDEIDNACTKMMDKIKRLPKPPTDIWLMITEEGLTLKFKQSSVDINYVNRNYCPAASEKSKKENYVQLLVKSLGKEYIENLRKALKKGAPLYNPDQRRIYKQLTGREDHITAIFGIVINADESLGKAELLCPSPNQPFNEILLKKYNKIEQLPLPEPKFLDPNKQFKFIWIHTLYFNNTF